TSTPSVYHNAWRRACWRLSPLCASPSTFNDSTGSTHGIRLRTRPPARASSRIQASESVVPAAAGGWLRPALSAEASGAAGDAAPLPSLERTTSGCGAGGLSGSTAGRSAGLRPLGSGGITSGVTAASPLGDTLPAGSDSLTRRVIGG